MKSSILFLLLFYQMTVAVLLKNLGLKTECRYSPSCSHYARQVIAKHGVTKGGILAVRRLFSCQPFFA